MTRKSIVATTLLLIASCRTMPRAQPDTGGVEHLVICWLKTPGDEAARKRLIDESKSFVGVIPGLLDVSAGTALPSTRPAVDSSFDVAVVMTFKDEPSLRAYDQHPTHKRSVERVLRPLVGKLVIYDVVIKR